MASKICLDWRWSREQSNVLKIGWCKRIGKNNWKSWILVGLTWAYQHYIDVHYRKNVNRTPLSFWHFFTTMHLVRAKHTFSHVATWSTWRLFFTKAMYSHPNFAAVTVPVQLHQETYTSRSLQHITHIARHKGRKVADLCISSLAPMAQKTPTLLAGDRFQTQWDCTHQPFAFG